MEYPHWMIVTGALLVVSGFMGLGFSWYMNRAPAEDNLHPEAPSNSSVEEEESARGSSAALWKPADDDQLREMGQRWARALSRLDGYSIAVLQPSENAPRFSD
jgi:hypothetical protein